jgi:hypothetical protein
VGRGKCTLKCTGHPHTQGDPPTQNAPSTQWRNPAREPRGPQGLTHHLPSSLPLCPVTVVPVLSLMAVRPGQPPSTHSVPLGSLPADPGRPETSQPSHHPETGKAPSLMPRDRARPGPLPRRHSTSGKSTLTKEGLQRGLSHSCLPRPSVTPAARKVSQGWATNGRGSVRAETKTTGPCLTFPAPLPRAQPSDHPAPLPASSSVLTRGSPDLLAVRAARARKAVSPLASSYGVHPSSCLLLVHPEPSGPGQGWDPGRDG